MKKHIIEKLKDYLSVNFFRLQGDFVKRNNGYDRMICDLLDEFKVDTCRYWDALWTNNGAKIPIEFKKGKSIWLNLVRYSEIKLGSCSDAKKETITLFFIPNKNKNKIDLIIGMKTSKLIHKLAFDTNDANFIISLSKIVPRSLNTQASLTVNDLKKIADFIIE